MRGTVERRDWGGRYAAGFCVRCTAASGGFPHVHACPHHEPCHTPARAPPCCLRANGAVFVLVFGGALHRRASAHARRHTCLVVLAAVMPIACLVFLMPACLLACLPVLHAWPPCSAYSDACAALLPISELYVFCPLCSSSATTLALVPPCMKLISPAVHSV
jgi:hypothetical protein